MGIAKSTTRRGSHHPIPTALLGIAEQRRGHFWGMRGGNRLEACRLLLVVGTSAVRPEQVARLARAYYRDDHEPLDETAAPDAEGRWGYHDACTSAWRTRWCRRN